jgi:glycosyltransferase involved in cell wall biosynthesis
MQARHCRRLLLCVVSGEVAAVTYAETGMWLQRALASLLLQNHSKWLAVVVDDASNDNTTAQVAASAAASDGRIIHWHNEQRMGALANTVAGS